jgi:hypothetical protein
MNRATSTGISGCERSEMHASRRKISTVTMYVVKQRQEIVRKEKEAMGYISPHRTGRGSPQVSLFFKERNPTSRPLNGLFLKAAKR